MKGKCLQNLVLLLLSHYSMFGLWMLWSAKASRDYWTRYDCPQEVEADELHLLLAHNI